MNEGVAEKRAAVDVMDELNTKLRDIDALLDLLSTCDHDECDVNGVAFAMKRMVQGAQTLADELYHAQTGGVS